jgi:hypothetical protein
LRAFDNSFLKAKVITYSIENTEPVYSVSIVTILQVDDRGFGASFPAGTHQTGSEDHPAFYPMRSVVNTAEASS